MIFLTNLEKIEQGPAGECLDSPHVLQFAMTRTVVKSSTFCREKSTIEVVKTVAGFLCKPIGGESNFAAARAQRVKLHMVRLTAVFESYKTNIILS